MGGRCPPYSNGSRNCLSAEQKCDEVTAAAILAAPDSTNKAAMARVCAIVEHAPYCPKKGIFKLRKPNVEEIH